jgi:hypothetical protein
MKTSDKPYLLLPGTSGQAWTRISRLISIRVYPRLPLDPRQADAIVPSGEAVDHARILACCREVRCVRMERAVPVIAQADMSHSTSTSFTLSGRVNMPSAMSGNYDTCKLDPARHPRHHSER